MNRSISTATIGAVLVLIGAASYGSGALQHNQPIQYSHSQTVLLVKRVSSSDQGGDDTSGPPSRAAHNEQAVQAAGSPAARYCADRHNKSDIQPLVRAGGIVQIFQHENTLADAYGCATVYLKHGGNVNAVDPRPDSEHLTPLLFAVKHNDPRMVRFMLDHGADPEQRAGTKQIKPYGYAVYQALHHRRTNYNTVISLLNSALDDNPAPKHGS